MTHKFAIPATLALTLATAGSTLSAQTVLSGNHSVDGSLCAGVACTGSESFTGADFKIKANDPELLFEDVSGSSLPNRNWRILTNENGFENFVIEDVDAFRDVFVIEGNSLTNSLYVANGGRVGLGTSMPQHELHIGPISTPVIRLENLTNSWDIRSNSSYIWFQNEPAGNFPFVVSRKAPNDAIRINDVGNVGLGTGAPQAPLELSSLDAFNFFRITAEGAAVNESVDITFTGGPLGTGQLRYNIVDGDNQEMSLDADGNVVIDGTLTTSGPTCSGGCDRVFDADYPLPSIADHAKQMFAAGHLPHVGPTLAGKPINMTEKMGNMLNALEHAHIYINQLHNTAEAERAHVDQLQQKVAALTLRLEALEAK